MGVLAVVVTCGLPFAHATPGVIARQMRANSVPIAPRLFFAVLAFVGTRSGPEKKAATPSLCLK